jgi:hypothetical protein
MSDERKRDLKADAKSKEKMNKHLNVPQNGYKFEEVIDIDGRSEV